MFTMKAMMNKMNTLEKATPKVSSKPAVTAA